MLFGYVLSLVNGILYTASIIPVYKEQVAVVGFVFSSIFIIVGLLLYSKRIRANKKWLSTIINIVIFFYVVVAIIGIIDRICKQ